MRPAQYGLHVDDEFAGPAVQNGLFGAALTATRISQDRRHNGYRILRSVTSGRSAQRVMDLSAVFIVGRLHGGSNR